MFRPSALALSCAVILSACSHGAQTKPESTAPAAQPVDELTQARDFLAEAERRAREVFTESVRAQWAFSTNITDENQERASEALEKVLALSAELVERARKLECVDGLSASECRQLALWARPGSLPAPHDAEKRRELSQLSTQMEGAFGSAKVCEGDKCQSLDELADVLSDSRDEAELRRVWEGWRASTRGLAEPFVRGVKLANVGAQDAGYDDLSAVWLGGYDMPPEQVEALLASLWEQVAPLYEALHCHVRAKLAEKYGKEIVKPGEPIPAHLLGNMWAQEWSGVYPLMAPYPDQPSLDVTKALVEQKYDEKRMTKLAEGFFMSLGMPELPPTFWQRSLFARPEDREVVCHASAWDVTFDNDLRLKMCVKQNQTDLVTLHHELGHLYYFMAYHELPIVLQDGANDGFHEAIGDTIARSITPSYLSKVGLLEQTSDAPEAVINQLFKDALDKVAFLPWGYLVDRFRWEAFRTEDEPQALQARWWELRENVQGVQPPGPRPEGAFDPGAKYHVAAGVPYARYFFASILQFELHRALCEQAGHEGPLHACSIYESKKAGERLWALLELGASRPWPEALAVVTGKQTLDASAMLEYYAPLAKWLAEQNEGRSCGW